MAQPKTNELDQLLSGLALVYDPETAGTDDNPSNEQASPQWKTLDISSTNDPDERQSLTFSDDYTVVELGTSNAVVTGTGDHMVLVGGAGGDNLTLNTQWGEVYGGVGDDWINVDGRDSGSQSHLLASGGAGFDYITARATGSGLVTLMGDEGNDVLAFEGDRSGAAYGGSGDDMIGAQGGGSHYFDGGAGDDLISGGAGDDIIAGGTGYDIVGGGAGNDTYYYNAGDGFDWIGDHSGTMDQIIFGSTIHSTDLLFGQYQAGGDYLIGFVGRPQDHIQISASWNGQSYETPASIERYQLTDGSGQSLSATELTALLQQMSQYAQVHGIDLSDLNQVAASSDLRSMIVNAWTS